MLARGPPSTGLTGTVDRWMVTSVPPGLWLPELLCLVCSALSLGACQEAGHRMGHWKQCLLVILDGYPLRRSYL